jgi:hypothetical protein
MVFHLKNLINSTRGKYLFSILLGLGLATLFRKACASRDCLVFKAPDLKTIKNKFFKHNDECYKYTEKSVTCNDTNNTDPYNSNNTIIDI